MFLLWGGGHFFVALALVDFSFLFIFVGQQFLNLCSPALIKFVSSRQVVTKLGD
jgi:hypothetical protein